jgi:CDP-diglyceride synthetase
MQTELKSRVITASLLVAVTASLLTGAYFFPIFRYLNLALVFTLVAICAFEVASVASNNWTQVNKGISYLGILIAIPLGTLFGLSSHNLDNVLQISHVSLFYPLCSVWIVLLLILSMELWPRRFDLREGQTITAEILPMLLLVGVGGACFEVLAVSANSSSLILWMLLVVCLSDTSAYFFGKRWGVTKLAPAISPNKTIVGAIASLATALVVGFLLRGLLGLNDQPILVAVVSIFAGCLGQLGDLCKSYFKRLHNVKDFSELLPGHGGLMDRLDAALATAPLVCFLFLGS